MEFTNDDDNDHSDEDKEGISDGRRRCSYFVPSLLKKLKQLSWLGNVNKLF